MKMVMDGAVRGIDHLPTFFFASESKIDILIIHHVIFVDRSDILETRAAPEDGSAGDALSGFYVIILSPISLPKATIAEVKILDLFDPDAIDPPIHEKNLTPYTSDALVALQQFNKAREPVFLNDHIVIQKPYELSFGATDT